MSKELDIPEGEYGRTREGKKVGPLYRVKTEFVTPGFYYTCDQQRGGYYAEGVSQRDGKERPTDLVGPWLTDGPVRTVTRREVVPGVWSGVVIERPTVAVNLHVHFSLHDPSNDELKAAAAVLLELAGALDSAE